MAERSIAGAGESVERQRRLLRARRRLELRLGGPALVKGLLLVLAALVATAFVTYYVERAANPQVTSVGSGFYWTFLSFIQAPPFALATAAGRALEVVVGFLRLILLGIVVAWLTQRTLEYIRRRSAGMMDADLVDHIVICGWSSKGSDIISEIRGRTDQESRRPIAVLAGLAVDPTRDELSMFVSGDPTSDEDLRRAGIERAAIAIVLADNSLPGVDVEDVDSRTLLTVLAIESINPRCYTCVEVMRSENAEHFSRTKADELVVSGHLSGALLAHSAVVRGLAGVVTDLISHPEGDEFYSVVVPDDLVGVSFAEALTAIKQRLDALPVALEQDGVFRTNPPAGERLSAGQRLLVIAKGTRGQTPAPGLRRG